jgi:effector-binding domain-containing protein
MATEVAVRTVTARPTAVVAATTTWPEFPELWRPLLDQVYACVRDRHGTRQGSNVMLYLDDTPHVEVGVEPIAPCPLDPPVRASTLPAGEVAVAVHRGPYGNLGAAHRAVLGWCAAAGRRPAGPRWEVYGDWREDPAELATEVYYLLG